GDSATWLSKERLSIKPRACIPWGLRVRATTQRMQSLGWDLSMDNNSKRFWAWPDELRRRGILGINNRNVEFILEHNPRELYPRVDNKLKTKEICQEHGIQVPETYFVMTEH